MFNQYIYNKENPKGVYIGGSKRGTPEHIEKMKENNKKSQNARTPYCRYKDNKAVEKNSISNNTAFYGWNTTSLRNLSGDFGIKNRKNLNKVQLCQALEPFKQGNILSDRPNNKWNDFIFPDIVKKAKLKDGKIIEETQLIPPYKELYDKESRQQEPRTFGKTLAGFNYLNNKLFKNIPKYNNYPDKEHIKKLLKNKGVDYNDDIIDAYYYDLTKRLDRTKKIKKPVNKIMTTVLINKKDKPIKIPKSKFIYKIPKKNVKITPIIPKKNINIDEDFILPPKNKPYNIYSDEFLLNRYNKLINETRGDIIENPKIRKIRMELQRRKKEKDLII